MIRGNASMGLQRDSLSALLGCFKCLIIEKLPSKRKKTDSMMGRVSRFNGRRKRNRMLEEAKLTMYEMTKDSRTEKCLLIPRMFNKA